MSQALKRGESSRSLRGGASKRLSRPSQNLQIVKPAKFAKPARMASAKSQIDGKRRGTYVTSNEEYLSSPPACQDLIEAMLVVPGKHLLPRGLDNLTALDAIRKSHKVWITNKEPNIFHICSDTMPRLQAAVQAINGTIHDMRLSNEHLSTRYIVQQPARLIDNMLIRVRLGTRPCLANAITGPCDISMPLAAHIIQLRSDLLPSAEILMALRTDLRMRVNFGRLNIRQRKQGLGNELTYEEFSDMMSAYSARGGARLETWLADSRLAENVLQHLTNPQFGINPGQEHLKQSYSLTLQVKDQELLVDALILPDNNLHLSPVGMFKQDSWARLNWTMAAPDMGFDWNLRVDSYEGPDAISSELRKLVEELSLSFPRDEEHGHMTFRVPRLISRWPGNWDGKVSEARLKTTISIPFRNTPYVIDISITQVWKGLKPIMEPETGWGIEVYGIHWDEAMNQVSPGERRKDWGEGLKNIWVGTDPDLGNRFEDFLQIILQIQSALEGMDSSAI